MIMTITEDDNQGQNMMKMIMMMKKIRKLHCINPKGKVILSPQEKHQWPRFKVSSVGISPEIHILIQSSIPILTKLDNA